MDITLKLIYEKLEEAADRILGIEKKLVYADLVTSSKSNHESELTNEINTALSKAQGEYPPICLNRTDQYLNNVYTDIDNIMIHIRPILAKHEISITQRTLVPDDGKTFIQTRIWHSSGQWIQSLERFKPTENDLDCYHSEMNVIRKSQIMSLLNITIKNDKFDDNGYAALKTVYKEGEKPKDDAYEYDPKNESFETVNKSDVEQIRKELAFTPGYEKILLKGLHVRTLADIPKSRLYDVLANVRLNKESQRN